MNKKFAPIIFTLLITTACSKNNDGAGAGPENDYEIPYDQVSVEAIKNSLGVSVSTLEVPLQSLKPVDQAAYDAITLAYLGLEAREGDQHFSFKLKYKLAGKVKESDARTLVKGDFGPLMNSLDMKKELLASKDLHDFKVRWDKKIASELNPEGQDLRYNKAFRSVFHLFQEDKALQCFSGTNWFFLNLRRGLTRDEFKQKNLVVIHTPMHVLPGYLVKNENKEWVLHGVETTASGPAHIVFGPTKSLQGHILIIDAELFYFIQSVKSMVGNLPALRDFAIIETAKRYKVDLERLDPSVVALSKGRKPSSLASPTHLNFQAKNKIKKNKPLRKTASDNDPQAALALLAAGKIGLMNGQSLELPQKDFSAFLATNDDWKELMKIFSSSTRWRIGGDSMMANVQYLGDLADEDFPAVFTLARKIYKTGKARFGYGSEAWKVIAFIEMATGEDMNAHSEMGAGAFGGDAYSTPFVIDDEDNVPDGFIKRPYIDVQAEPAYTGDKGAVDALVKGLQAKK